MDVKENLLMSIENQITVYANWVNQGGGIRSDASEDLYRELLNTAWDYLLQNMNWAADNFPAIDLGDAEERLAVQVTSTGTADKVRKTLDRFYKHGLDAHYDRLIVLIAGKAECKPTKFDHSGLELEIWGTAELIRELRKLSVKKLREVDDFLKSRVDAPQMRLPPIRLPLSTSLGLEGFVGRKQELAAMAQAIKDKVKPLVVWGLGGMGKTELANHFGRTYTAGRVYLALFRGNFRDTVTQGIAPGIAGLEKLTEAERYAPAMDRLRQCSENDILIIDNADLTEGTFEDLVKENACRELCELPMHIIITTRLRVRDGIGLTRLENPELYKIFRRHGVELPAEKMDALIDAVNGHTMTVDLIARTLDESWEEVTADMILEAMAHSTLPEADYPEVCSDRNRDPEQRQIYAHLRTLFNLTGIPEDGRYALRCATLLPAGGMDPQLFCCALPEDARKAIRLLEKRGWVSRENHLLTIHPVVRMVCRAELEPDDENCNDFLEGVRGQYDEKAYSHRKYTQMAGLFEEAAVSLPDRDGYCAGWAGYLWNQVAEPQRALFCNMRAVVKREKEQPDSQVLATVYNNMGSDYSVLGDYKNALEYKLKALEIRKRQFPTEYSKLARAYNNVGYVYGKLGDNKQRLKYYNEALLIRENVFPEGHIELARSYNNMGSVYDALGELEKALSYKLKGLEIRIKELGEEHPDLAQSYNNVGYTYGRLGNHERELEYKLKALEIREKSLSEKHPSLAASYNNIAWTYYRTGQVKLAAKNMRRASDIISSSSLPEGHTKRINYTRWADRFEREARQAQSVDDPDPVSS